jgi:carboxymethylenebutenolidase
MTAFQRYLAEEVAIDHADGMISRREALRRLGLLGLGVPAASALLACGGGGEPAAPSATAGSGTTCADTRPGRARAARPALVDGPRRRVGARRPAAGCSV